jgi:hypothetical protein
MDFRTIALGVTAFCATFLVGWWLNLGSLASGLPFARPAAEAAVTTGHATSSPTEELTASEGKGLTDNQSLRDAVVAWSNAYQRPACDQDVRWGYVSAASRYAEVLMRAAGCNPRSCELSTVQLERAWLANRSTLDLPVANAMAAAHAAGGLGERAFRGDLARAVRVIAGRDFDPGPAPDCSTRSGRNWSPGRNWSFRIRRR